MIYALITEEYMGCPAHDANGYPKIKFFNAIQDIFKWVIDNFNDFEPKLALSFNEETQIEFITRYTLHHVKEIEVEINNKHFTIAKHPTSNTPSINIGSEWMEIEEVNWEEYEKK